VAELANVDVRLRATGQARIRGQWRCFGSGARGSTRARAWASNATRPRARGRNPLAANSQSVEFRLEGGRTKRSQLYIIRDGRDNPLPDSGASSSSFLTRIIPPPPNLVEAWMGLWRRLNSQERRLLPQGGFGFRNGFNRLSFGQNRGVIRGIRWGGMTVSTLAHHRHAIQVIVRASHVLYCSLPFCGTEANEKPT
jgi:hypothetical protein